jgi:hypothetical protein
MPTESYSLAAANDWKPLFDKYDDRKTTMTAWGSWTWDKNSGRPWCGPGGNGNPATGGSPEPGAEGCLVWRVKVHTQGNPAELYNPDHWTVRYHTYFSSDAQSYDLTMQGSYEFRMNDNDLSGNDGIMNVVVTR